MEFKIIVDADILLHRLAYSIQKKAYYFKPKDIWEGPFFMKKDLLNHYFITKDDLIEGQNFYEEVEVLDIDLGLYLSDSLYKLMQDAQKSALPLTKGEEVEFLFIRSPLDVKELNFRYQLPSLLPYKGNRNEKPVKFQELYGSDHWDAFEVMEPRYGEADDLIAEMFNYTPENSIICSIDGDFKMLPCHYLNMTDLSFMKVTREEAIKNFWLKVYEGDASDCIPGLYKCVEILKGELRAKEIKHSHYKKKMRELFDCTHSDCLKDIVFNEFRGHGIEDGVVHQHMELINFRKQDGSRILEYML